MKISVKNFGPIKEAQNIEIKPLTVFAGPSNTGKTYLATLIYSLLKMMRGRAVSRRKVLGYIEGIDKSFFDLLRSEKEGKEVLNKIKRKIDSVIFPAMMKSNQSLWKEEMLRCFGDTGNVLLKRKIECVISDAQGRYLLNINSPGDSWTEESFDSTLEKFWKENQGLGFYRYINHYLITGIFEKIYDDILNPCLGDIYYLPAIRGGVMQSHRGLASAAVRQAPMIGLRESQTIPVFNGVLADFLEDLLMVNDPQRRFYISRFRRVDKKNNGFPEIELYLETEVLKGKINIQETETQYPEFFYAFGNGKSKDRDISLMQASSMVSELAPLSLFIRNYLQKGDTLIFEEPEAHLHPEAQRTISEVIVMLVKAGVRVIITTHSDYIIEQLGNFIHADGVPAKKKIKLLGKDIAKRAIKPEQVALYDFERKKIGTYVTHVPYDPESGIIPKEHDKVLGALHNETVDLLNARNGDE